MSKNEVTPCTKHPAVLFTYTAAHMTEDKSLLAPIFQSSGNNLLYEYTHIYISRLLVLVCVYLIGGGVYNRTVREANGVDVIPNVSFWKELPSLIKVRKMADELLCL